MSKIKKVVKKIQKKMSVKTPAPYAVFEGRLLEGKNALITGGGSGIGFSIAECFVKNGANVMICGRNEQKLKDAVKKLQKLDAERTIDYAVLDVSKADRIKETLDKKLEDKQAGMKIDIVVNNAGVGNPEAIGKTTTENFESIIGTNLEGTYFVSQYFLNYMRTHKIHGNIFFIASSSSLRPANTPYIVSKWGVLGLIKGLAKVGIKDGIVVNGVAPGPTATSMLGKDGASDLTNPGNPAGRLAMPEEIANLSAVLVSGLGRMVVGDVLFATGGAGVITFDDVSY